jgi:hypothetical protein
VAFLGCVSEDQNAPGGFRLLNSHRRTSILTLRLAELPFATRHTSVAFCSKGPPEWAGLSLLGVSLYILYLDESGNENDPNDRFFVLAGMALFERQTYFLSQALDEIQRKYFPRHQPIPFHASEIRSGRNLWRKVDEATRHAVLADVAEAISRSPDRGRALYAAAIEKSDALWGESAAASTFGYSAITRRSRIPRED